MKPSDHIRIAGEVHLRENWAVQVSIDLAGSIQDCPVHEPVQTPEYAKRTYAVRKAKRGRDRSHEDGSEEVSQALHRTTGAWSRWRWVLLATLPLVALICFLLVGVTAWVGGRWAVGPWSVGNPKWRFLAGALASALWYLVYLKRPGVPLPWKLIAARFALLTFTVVVSLAFAEWTFRRQMQHSQGFGTLEMLRAYEEGAVIEPRSKHPVALLVTLCSNRKLIYELRANMDRPYGDYHVRSNRDGLRESRTYEKTPPPGTRRILGIGDSGMFGWDVPQNANYLAVLEQALAERTDPGEVEVLNAGVPGYNTQQEVEWLASKGLIFEPDVVVVGWCANDYDAPFFLYQPVDYMALPGSLLYQFVFERERFLAAAKPDVSIYTDFDRAHIHPEVMTGMGEEGVRKSFSRLRDLSVEHGFKVLVFGPMGDPAQALCRELELPFLNTHDSIPKGSVPARYKVHHMHPTEEGHAVLAEHLERELDRLGWLTPSEGGGQG